MLEYSVTFENDDAPHRIWLIGRSEGLELERSFPINSGVFAPGDLEDVALATGWVQRERDQLRLRSDVSPAQLAEVVEEILTYFDAPDVPCSNVLSVKEAVGEYSIVQESSIEIPLFAYAWVDVCVRDEIADLARNEVDVWAAEQPSVDCESICEKWVENLIDRYSDQNMRMTGRMARSLHTRSSDTSQPKTG